MRVSAARGFCHRSTANRQRPDMTPPRRARALLFTKVDESMAAPAKKRRPNFTQDELLCLVSSVQSRWSTINGILSSSLTAAMKQRAWEAVTADVNAVSDCVRSVEEVKNKFTDFKCHTKKRMAKLNKEITGTGEENILTLT